MRILLVDSTQHYPSNPLFLEALTGMARGRGWEYRFVDEASFLGRFGQSILGRAAYRLLGRRPVGYWAFNRILKTVSRKFCPDVVLVVKGAHIAPEALAHIRRETRAFLINYATDDPFNAAVSTRDLVESIPLYDLYACTKRAIMADVRAAGCPRVAWVPFGFKPNVHFPEAPRGESEQARFEADVVFVGTCDETRPSYVRDILAANPGVRLRLYGAYWERCLGLRSYYGGFVYGREYRLALCGGRIVLNFLRRANRDGHTLRTFEVPACGAFMLAERTAEHREFLLEDGEVACFDTPAELAGKVHYYLARPDERDRIRNAAYLKVTKGGHTYRDRLLQILAEAGVV